MQDSTAPDDTSAPTTHTDSVPALCQRGTGCEGPLTNPPGVRFTIKVRLSILPKDVRVLVLTTDRIRDLKRKLHERHNVSLQQKITMLYSGRVLSNSTLIKQLNVPKGHVIQAIVS